MAAYLSLEFFVDVSSDSDHQRAREWSSLVWASKAASHLH